MTRSLRVIVVDDEPPARRRLCRLLGGLPDVMVVGEAGDGGAAVALAAELRPDVLMLDIQMPAPSGLEVVNRLAKPRPHIIFVTAFDRFAVRAFELQAMDYLLKPVTAARLADAVSRVRQGMLAPAGVLQRIPVKRSGRIDLVDTTTIEWIEAADNYAVIHAAPGRYVIRETLAGLGSVLDPTRFARVHRSAILALPYVLHLTPAERGDWIAHMRSGAKVGVSRTYRQSLLDRLAGTAT